MDEDNYKIFDWIRADTFLRHILLDKIELGILNNLNWSNSYHTVIWQEGKRVFPKDYKFICLKQGYGRPAMKFSYKNTYYNDTIHHCFMLKKDAPKHWNLNVPWPNITTITL